MTIKHVISLTSNVKHYNKPYTHTFKPGCKVVCLQGESGGGKSAFENSIRLALLGNAWFDVLGKSIKDPKMLSRRLNQGEPIEVCLVTNKGESRVSLKASKHGKYPRSLPHSGYFPPLGGNLAATVKDILTRSPAKMVAMLVDLVVANVTGKQLLAELKIEATKNLLAQELTKTKSPVEALNAAIEELKKRLKEANAQLKPLVAADDPGAAPVNTALLQAAKDDRDYWVGQEALCIAFNQKSDVEQAEIDLRGEVQKVKEQLADLFLKRAALPQVDTQKVEAYRAGETLSLFAVDKGLKKCPLCGGEDGLQTTIAKKAYKDDPKAATLCFQDKALAFAGFAHNEECVGDTAAEESVTSRINKLQKSLDAAEMALKRLGSNLKGSEPKFSLDVIAANKEKGSNKVAAIQTRMNRFEAQERRKKQRKQVTDRIEGFKLSVAELEGLKKTFVDAEFGEFLERARYYMPKASVVKGGILHFNLETREVGFLRNGVLYSDPSGSELRVIVAAMALAAGHIMREPPPVFLDDVGWGVDLLEGALNAWAKYPGVVFISTTAKVRQSKVSKEVEIVDITKVTTHTKAETLPVEVASINQSEWAQRPETPQAYKVSVFRQCFAELPMSSQVMVTHRHKKGSKGSVDQSFLCRVIGANKKNITVLTEGGAGFTFSKETGRAAMDPNSFVSGIRSEDLRGTYMQLLVDYLGYADTTPLSLAQTVAIWDQQIGAKDLLDRKDQIPAE